VSADSPEKLREFRETKGLDYTLLSDASQDASRAFGLAWQLSDAEVARLRGFGIDVEAASGRDHHQLPVPAVFLVDAQRIIRFRSFDPDYTVRLPTGRLLEEARAMAGAAAP
jgi:peroxiredoxin